MAEGRRDDSPYAKADLTLRGLARLADFTIAFGVAVAAPWVGPLLAAAYLLLADGWHGQSPGKRIFGVKVVVPATRAPAGWQESALRNAPFAAMALFWSLPLLWPLFFLVAIPVVGYEAWRAWDDPLGRRRGDAFDETQVVDAKVTAGAEARLPG